MFMKVFSRAGQKMKSYRTGSAIIFSFLALVVMIGAVQASGPMRPPCQPCMPPGGMWQMGGYGWWPMEPVPEIHIIAVEKNVSVTFETENFPEDEIFTVTMGYMYTRGVDGIEVGTFDSLDGETTTYTFDIPSELADQYKISIRAQSDHPFPYFYYAFNWFYNNSTNGIEEL